MIKKHESLICCKRPMILKGGSERTFTHYFFQCGKCWKVASAFVGLTRKLIEVGKDEI